MTLTILLQHLVYCSEFKSFPIDLNQRSVLEKVLLLGKDNNTTFYSTRTNSEWSIFYKPLLKSPCWSAWSWAITRYQMFLFVTKKIYFIARIHITIQYLIIRGKNPRIYNPLFFGRILSKNLNSPKYLSRRRVKDIRATLSMFTFRQWDMMHKSF